MRNEPENNKTQIKGWLEHQSENKMSLFSFLSRLGVCCKAPKRYEVEGHSG